MMKRLTALIGTVAALCAFSFSTASAQSPHWTWKDLSFRTSTNATTVGLSDAQIAAGFVDSTARQSNGVGINAGAATSLADTTAPFTFNGFAAPSSWANAVGADSTTLFRLSIWDAGSSTAVANFDTLYVIPQASQDGVNWLSAAVVTGNTMPANFATAAAITDIAKTIYLGASTANKGGSVCARTRVSNAVTPTWENLWSYRYVRFILIHDISTAGRNNWRAAVGYFSTLADR